MALNLQHQTPAQFAARYWTALRASYDAGDKARYHYLIWWVWDRIQVGDLTSDQIRLSYNAFFDKSLNTSQWNTLVTTRFVPIKDRYLAYIAETLV
jgi:hypothetical protein